MTSKQVTRRDFVAGGLAAAVKEPNRGEILNHNPNMEYRRLGRTGLMVSAVSMGGHWKRVGIHLKGNFTGEGYLKNDMASLNHPGFLQNRHAVVSRAIEAGINYIDACSGPEVMAYSTVLKGRRHKVYLGYSWHVKESRYADWRSAGQLLKGLDEGLREAKLDYVDVWRISLPLDSIGSLGELVAIETGAAEALQKAKKQGKARFTGVSTHNRVWLKSMIEQYPGQMEVVLFPYTASSKELPGDSVFEAVKKHDVGVFGIKPFADNSLFQGDGSPASPHAEEDSRRARLAIRYILGNPAITAPIPGLASIAQVDNAAKAVMERRKLDAREKADLRDATGGMWSRLRPDHQWLRDWEYV